MCLESATLPEAREITVLCEEERVYHEQSAETLECASSIDYLSVLDRTICSRHPNGDSWGWTDRCGSFL